MQEHLPPQTGLKCLHWVFSLSLVYAHMLLACTYTTLGPSILRLGWYFSRGWKEDIEDRQYRVSGI